MHLGADAVARVRCATCELRPHRAQRVHLPNFVSTRCRAWRSLRPTTCLVAFSRALSSVALGTAGASGQGEETGRPSRDALTRFRAVPDLYSAEQSRKLIAEFR